MPTAVINDIQISPKPPSLTDALKTVIQAGATKELEKKKKNKEPTTGARHIFIVKYAKVKYQVDVKATSCTPTGIWQLDLHGLDIVP